MKLGRDSLVFVPNQKVVLAFTLLTRHVLASREAEVPAELVVPLLKFVPVTSVEEVVEWTHLETYRTLRGVNDSLAAILR